MFELRFATKIIGRRWCRGWRGARWVGGGRLVQRLVGSEIGGLLVVRLEGGGSLEMRCS